ncbi:hypothetical protein OOT46_16645 [Aquabacterium sp. A7-Y]|uniref:hypothetical protein n=1 Tax=Aquabacterium sp. A7-Y TaxID=1349605 RepID=UPI00223E1F14|nr:hypothetical protein [Aquabacterium sp. A7-Y]MCW7539472.1 hypothetical protein [Aquabacterium sp. A7-Y]
MFAEEQAEARQVLRYRVLCDEEAVGHILALRRVVQCGDEPALILRNEMSIRARGLWSDYALDTEEEMILDGRGLSRYVGVSTEDGDEVAVTIDRDGGQLMLHIKEDRVHTERIALTDIDATSEDAVSCFLRSERPQSVLRVLDLDHFDIDELQFRLLPRETLTVAGTERTTRVVAFESKKRRLTGRGWYVPDDSGFVLVREVSREKGDLNEVLLIDWEHT